ncbi:hypothetical protein [Huintestinicola sp.]
MELTMSNSFGFCELSENDVMFVNGGINTNINWSKVGLSAAGGAAFGIVTGAKAGSVIGTIVFPGGGTVGGAFIGALGGEIGGAVIGATKSILNQMFL